MKTSCLYVGQVRHRRFSPREHHFSYKLFMMYLDLSELDSVFDSDVKITSVMKIEHWMQASATISNKRQDAIHKEEYAY